MTKLKQREKKKRINNEKIPTLKKTCTENENSAHISGVLFQFLAQNLFTPFIQLYVYYLPLSKSNSNHLPCIFITNFL